jgi:bifunctional NMN adenylyltransferase/nudix hydrolase
MKTIQESETATAAIVGRFQLPSLHNAHRQLFEEVLKKHQRVLVFIGVSRILGTRNDPLDFITRKNMIEETFPEVTCLPLGDIPGNDVAWSQLLDDAIHLITPIGQITLYGGRDSFVKHYSGKHRTVELDAFAWETGTDIRESVGKTPLTSEEARKGVIYLAENQYPRVNQVVDLAILRNEGGSRQVLLGQRENDRDSSLNWRFPGGFVNASDPSLEAACRREGNEETNILAESPVYLCSLPIGDSRMKGGDIIMTAFFKAEYVMGSPKGGDDIRRVEWFDLLKLPEGYMYPNHLPLLVALIASELG